MTREDVWDIEDNEKCKVVTNNLEKILFKQSTLKLEELNKQCEPDSIEMNPLLEYFMIISKEFFIFFF